jgi:hypothetical protein
MIRSLIWILLASLVLAPTAAQGQAVLGPKGPVRKDADPPPVRQDNNGA